MDYIEGLAKQASQLTMYDIKSYYNQAKNAVLNVSEMEGKVQEATNDDPWGASSTLMQQIADGTHNFQQFNEIMPTIYSRFMEKEAREWRQIYKALTLLEFLVKNGSERVVDDARAHISTIKMLRSFHYIDDKSKDQGINVRNRASEIASLLGDVDRIRSERRKAKANKSKYQGTGNEGGMSFATASGGRYGGFGSESLGSGGGGGSSSGGDYGRDGGYGREGRGERDFGSRADEYSARPRAARQAAPEYDEYEGADDFDAGPPHRSTPSSAALGASGRPSSSRPQPPPKTRAPAQAAAPAVQEAPKPKKEVNLFDFGDDDDVPAAAAVPSSAAPILGGDDDFDDFQTAPSAPPIASTPIQPSQPASTAAKGGNSGLFDLLNSGTPSTTTSSAARPAPASSNSFAPMGAAVSPGLSKPNYNSSTFTSTPAASSAPTPAQPQAKKGSGFDDLFTTSLSSISSSTKPTATGQNKGKSILEMQQEKANAQLWGTGSGGPGQQGQQQQQQGKGGFDDLLF